jgi:hypothetical protein
MTMPSPLTLPILAGLSILGGLFGIYLGNSAIAEINPAYFSEPETRFHADSVPYRSPDWAQVGAAEDAQLAEAPVNCIGCLAWPQEYRPVADRAVEIWEEDRPAGAPASAAIADPQPVVAAENPEWERIQAYASYPVGADERLAAEVEADDADDAAWAEESDAQ